VELDLTAQPVKGLQLVAGFGYLDGKYTSVRGDLNGDGVINQIDKNLILSRVPKYSTSVGAIYDFEVGSGASFRSQVFFSHRSRQAGQDSNVVFYPAYDDLRADITFTLPGKATSVSIYGRNLTNVARNTGSAGIVGALPSGGYKDVSEGRSVGVEVKQKF
jgi:iron complex outermembrane recepter protein